MEEFEDDGLINHIYDSLYYQYECDHSLSMNRYIHPMFYNGTFSENNEYQPENPGEIMSKEEFIENLDNGESKWSIGFEILYLYLKKQERQNDK